MKSSKFGPTDRDEGSKSRSSKSESSESRAKPESKHDTKIDESTAKPETFSSKDESSSSAASDKGKIDVAFNCRKIYKNKKVCYINKD